MAKKKSSTSFNFGANRKSRGGRKAKGGKGRRSGRGGGS